MFAPFARACRSNCCLFPVPTVTAPVSFRSCPDDTCRLAWLCRSCRRLGVTPVVRGKRNAGPGSALWNHLGSNPKWYPAIGYSVGLSEKQAFCYNWSWICHNGIPNQNRAQAWKPCCASPTSHSASQGAARTPRQSLSEDGYLALGCARVISQLEISCCSREGESNLSRGQRAFQGLWAATRGLKVSSCYDFVLTCVLCALSEPKPPPDTKLCPTTSTATDLVQGRGTPPPLRVARCSATSGCSREQRERRKGGRTCFGVRDAGVRLEGFACGVRSWQGPGGVQ